VLVYRVAPFLSTAPPGVPGHPLYLHRPQGHGRLDNPRHYDTWYFATTPEAAIGETFADLSAWSEDMFEFPKVPGARRALGTFEIDDGTPVLDLDDARALYERRLRPTQVIARNRAVTQSWALEVYNERNDRDERRWAGIRWWSFQRPHWTVLALWYAPGEPIIHRLIDVEDLAVTHIAVRDAARSLGKPFR
jgi:hypothetical protein